MTDITEPNRVREQLSASHERFTTVLEALDASISVAPLGSDELLFANKLYRLWFGTLAGGHLRMVAEAGVPVFGLNQDGTRYFDLHHTADDTLDKVDPAQMSQNVAAWAALVWLIADSEVDFRAMRPAQAAAH